MRTEPIFRPTLRGAARHGGRVAAAILLLVGLAVAPGGAHAAASEWSEYQIKAAFLYRFTEFVDWPAPPASQGPFVIGLLGDNPFGRALDETIRDRRVDGRRITVRRFDSVDEIEHCQVLFVSSNRFRDLDRIRIALGDRAVLTIGEPPDFARAGGMIRLYADGAKIRFEINVGALRGAGLQISAKLLSLARVIYEPSHAGAR